MHTVDEAVGKPFCPTNDSLRNSFPEGSVPGLFRHEARAILILGLDGSFFVKK